MPEMAPLRADSGRPYAADEVGLAMSTKTTPPTTPKSHHYAGRGGRDGPFEVVSITPTDFLALTPHSAPEPRAS